MLLDFWEGKKKEFPFTPISSRYHLVSLLPHLQTVGRVNLPFCSAPSNPVFGFYPSHSSTLVIIKVIKNILPMPLHSAYSTSQGCCFWFGFNFGWPPFPFFSKFLRSPSPTSGEGFIWHNLAPCAYPPLPLLFQQLPPGLSVLQGLLLDSHLLFTYFHSLLVSLVISSSFLAPDLKSQGLP